MTTYRLVSEGHTGRLRARGPDSHDAHTADDQTEPPTLWPLGAVVAFRRRSGTGFGQIERHEPDGRVTVRAWLPCRTRTLTLDPVDVRPVLELHQLHALLTR